VALSLAAILPVVYALKKAGTGDVSTAVLGALVFGAGCCSSGASCGSPTRCWT
jgi:hypothetical protein